MKISARILISAALLIMAAPIAFAADVAQAAKPSANTNVTAKAKLPRLVELGADKCIPCKKMAPILRELKSDYAGQLEVEFVDVWKDPDAAKPYNILLIPTQIFFDAAGKEVFRHEGFYGKDDILAKWKKLGVNLSRGKALTK